MAIGTSVSELQLATKRARHKLIDIAAAMELRVPSGSIASKLLHAPSDASAPGHGAQQSVSQSNLGGLELHATRSSDLNASQASDQKQSRSAVVEILAAGIQDITNAMVEDFKLSDVLRMILETMLRAMEFDRIIFCMRDSKTDMMVGRFGLGQGVEAQVKVFKSHLKASTPDLFSVVCLNGSDTLISDAADSRIVQRLPDWYKKQINAPTFLVLPLQIKGSPFGLIYADKTVRDSLELDEKELALLRTLRNQAVMAFRQSN
jgi:transcriptional regulator with GAF, ATPase, and Fis domain